MGPTRHSLTGRSRIGLPAALAAVILAGAGAGAALGGVTVYDNAFSSRGDVRQLAKAGGGKKCARRFAVTGKPRMRAIVRRGPANCRFRPPVQGDSALSNHSLRVDARISRSGSRRARASAFLLLRARVGDGTGYTLRIVPRRREWELRRNPPSAQFPISGRSRAINGIRKLNKVRLVTDGAELRASVNRRLLVAVTDSNPGAVTGTMLQFGIGHRAKSNDDLSAALTRVRVAVPSP